MIKHKILVISTGGTIAGEVAGPKKIKDNGATKESDFSEYMSNTVRHIMKMSRVELLIEQYELCDVDSSDINPTHWSQLATVIKDNYDKYDSFVVTHGTNTLGYTCAGLSFALHNNKKPVVLTGSQVPVNIPGSDAKMNLDNAIRIACWAQHAISGVIAVFGSHIITGWHAC